LKRDGFWIPNLIETHPCGAKNLKEICYRILYYREMGVRVLKVTMPDDMKDWFVNIMVLVTNLQISRLLRH